jgi:XTP/dITP diphosphohydrolase
VIELLVGTTNPGKLAEVEGFLKALPLKVRSLASLGNYPEVVEDGLTFEENALKKARTLAEHWGYVTLADDSGLEVDALDGAPGIYSARYSGEDATDAKNNKKLLYELRDIPWENRSARFVCVLALAAPMSRSLKELTVRDSCDGMIMFAPRGQHGFGYDPLFFFAPLGKTFAELDRETKSTVSHRGKALRKLAEILPLILRQQT